MAAVNDVPQLVNKNGGSYSTIAPKLEPGKFNKWKKRMLCYLAGMEPYYLKCIKDGSFQPKTGQGDAKPESQWTPDERRVVVQNQRLKSIIMPCLPDDIIESVISCVSAKETWTHLVHSFEGPSDTKENRIMDLKLEYQTFRAKSTESLSQTYTRYKTLLNELANDGVNLSKHEINVGFMNSLPKKWLTFSQGLRNANHTQTLDLVDIYGRFDFQENSDDVVDKRTSKEYQRDFDIEYHERALLKDYKAEYKKMKAKLALLEASPSSSQNPKTFQPKNKGLVAETFNWDEEEVTQVKVLMALADDELTVGNSHARNGEWVDITIRKVNTLLSMDEDADWQNYLKYINIDLKFVEEQRLNLLSKYNKMVFELNKCRDELLILKQAKLDAVTFQIQNTKLIKLNHALQEQLKEEKKINKKWLTSSKKVSQCISEQIPHQKKKVLGGELLTESSSKMNENENLFVPAYMGILVPESQAVNESLETSNTPESSKDSEAEFLTPLPPLKILQGASPSSEVMPLTFQPHSPKERPGLGIMKHTKPETQDSSNESVSGTVTVSESKQTTPSVPTEVKDTEQESKLNELTKLVQMLIDEKVNSDQKTQESNSKIQKAEPKPIQKPQLKCELCHYTNHLTDDCYRILYCMICKREDHKTSDHEMYNASLKRSENYKAQPYQYASSSKHIMKAKAKPFPPCTHYGFNDHRSDDYRNYPECEICGSYDHFTSGHNRVIHIRGGVLAESSQSNESSLGVKCNTCGSTIHSITDYNEFDHFKRETHQRAHLVPGHWMLKDISQLYDAKYIVQFDDKQGTIFNANKEIVLITPRRNDVYVLDMSSLTPNGVCFFAKALESVNWLWHKRLSHLNFKNINKLAKQSKVLGLPSLVYSKDKPCTTCEKGKHHRASFKTKQNFSIRKCLHPLHMDLFGLVSPMSINHEKYTLVIVDEYSRYTWVHFLKKKSQAPKIIMSFIRMVENLNNVKVKQIKTDNGTEFRNHELESFCDEKGISQNFSSPYTPEQNGVAERKNRTLIEAARTMLNGSVLSKHFWTEAVRIACYTQNRSIIVKRHDKTPYEIFRERIPDISYFHMFGCPMFIHNHKDHLGKFDAKADDGYFLGYSFVSKAFRVFNTRRQQVEETYHVTFDESMEAIRQYQVDFDVSYYIIPHGLSLTELTQENHVPEVIVPNEPNIPHTEDTEGPPDLINTEGTHEQNVQNDQMITQPTDISSGNNTEVSGSITESLVPDVTQYHISNQASTSSHPVPQDRWSKDQHIELVNIISDLGKGMLTRTMAAKLTASLASECLFADFLSKIEPKKAIGSKWVFRNKKDEHGITIKNKARLVAQASWLKSSEFPDYVYKLDKALYGLKQAPRACPVCKISVKSKGITSNNCEKNPQVLKGTPTIGLYYPKSSGFDLKGYSDSDYAGCNMDRKSTSGACQILGGKLMVPIFCDNTSAIAISNNPVLYSRTQHIDIRYHFIRDRILKGDIELHFIPTEYQLADIFTKPLDEPTFTRLKAELGMLNID
ncbi:retrovirus-related pol polyprotein from transposon TNT 1-94 [Tanacetum coccineum]